MATPPIIANTRQTSTVDEGSFLAFYGTTLTDSNPGALDTLTITVEGNGTLQDAALTRIGPNTYRLPTGDPGSVESYLSQIVFQPGPAAPSSVNVTRFVLDVTSSAGTSASDSSTTVTDVAAPPPDSIALDPTVAYADGTWTITGHATSYRGATSVVVQPNNGVAVTSVSVPIAADGSFSVALRGGGQGLSSINFYEALPSGAATATTQAPYNLSGAIAGERFVALKFDYAADGSTPAATEFFRADGSRRIAVQASGQTFQSDSFDTFDNRGAPSNTFVFDPGHGLDVVHAFRAGGTDHDTLSFAGADFGATPQAQLAELLSDTHNVRGGVAIVDPTTQDKVFLSGVTKGQLAQNTGDIAFHG